MIRIDILNQLAEIGAKELRRVSQAEAGYPKLRAEISDWISARPKSERAALRYALLSPRMEDAVQ